MFQPQDFSILLVEQATELIQEITSALEEDGYQIIHGNISKMLKRVVVVGPS